MSAAGTQSNRTGYRRPRRGSEWLSACRLTSRTGISFPSSDHLSLVRWPPRRPQNGCSDRRPREQRVAGTSLPGAGGVGADVAPSARRPPGRVRRTMGGSGPRGPRPRLVVIAPHVVQYQVPLYAEMARHDDVDLEVVFLSRAGLEPYHDAQFDRTISWDLDLLEGYRHTFLTDCSGGARVGLARAVRRADVVVIHGHSQPWMLYATGLCRAYGRPYLLRGEAWPEANVVGWRRLVREALAYTSVRGAAGGLANGSYNACFYQHFGAKAVYSAPYSVDTERFRRAAAGARHGRAQALAQLGLDPRRTTYVFAGKFIPKKRPLDLVRAVQQHPDDPNLLMIGDGPLLEQVRGEGAGLRLALPGFINQSDLPSILALGDVFVLPSILEPWGLVVNEALATGLLPVVSDRVGCAPDLVRGVGEVFPAGDVKALAAALILAGRRAPEEGWRIEAARRLETHSLTATARGYLDATLALAQ